MRTLPLLALVLLSGCVRVTPIANGARTDPERSPHFRSTLDHAVEAAKAACADFGATVTEVSGDDPRVLSASAAGETPVTITIELACERQWVYADIRVVAPSLSWSDQVRDVRFLDDAIRQYAARY